MDPTPACQTMPDDPGRLEKGAARFVTYGEVMIRDTPTDSERPERTRLVNLFPAGSGRAGRAA